MSLILAPHLTNVPRVQHSVEWFITFFRSFIQDSMRYIVPCKYISAAIVDEKTDEGVIDDLTDVIYGRSLVYDSENILENLMIVYTFMNFYMCICIYTQERMFVIDAIYETVTTVVGNYLTRKVIPEKAPSHICFRNQGIRIQKHTARSDDSLSLSLSPAAHTTRYTG